MTECDMIKINEQSSALVGMETTFVPLKEKIWVQNTCFL